LISFGFLRISCEVRYLSCKTTHSRRGYSGLRVHGLVPFADDLEALATVRGDLHLVPEPHVATDVLRGHADVVGDLVDLVALLGADQDARAAQAMDGRMVSVVGVDIPIVSLGPGPSPIPSSGGR
jgi:hypothetical protein